MNFDEIKDRRDRHTAKFDAMEARTGVSPDDGIAMWVADMDFDAPDCVLDALRAEVDEGYMGYFGNPGPVSEAVCGWLDIMHGWAAKPEWIRYTHGVVSGFGIVLEAFSDPGDNIILFTPVYHAFFLKARAMGREILESPLARRDGQYHMDLEALAGQLTGREKIAVLCSPHNPGGRLWTRDEIAALNDFCAEHGLLLLSDEIHMDLAFPDARHLPTAVAAPEAASRLITITAASKSFNIAGMETGFALIEDPALAETFDAAHRKMSGPPNRFGMIMTKAAFTHGAEWNAAVRDYLAENFRLWQKRIGALPGVSVMGMESTYLSWVDFEGTGMTAKEIEARIAGKARIGASPGSQFGAGGELFQRFNLAMPRGRLIEAMERMEAAFGDLQ